MKNIVVIGAGYAGLAAAALLAKEGHNVTILEKNDVVGGRARMYHEKGFSFDMGPSWYLMPDVFEKYFGYFGKKPSDYYALKRLDPSYRVYYTNGKTLDVPASRKEAEKLFASLEKDGDKKLQRFLSDAEEKYDVATKDFLYKDYNTIFDFLTPQLLRRGLKLGIFENLHSYVKKFFKNPEAQKLLEYTTVFLGGSPNNTPSVYSLLAHVDFNLGVYYPEGGLHAVAKGLAKLCKEQGVTIKLGEPATKINTKNKRAVSVRTNKSTYPCDAVLGAGDLPHIELELLEEKDRTYNKKYWESRVMAPSALLLYLGVKKKLPQLLHHTLILQDEWDQHFTQVFDKPAWPKHPSLYVCRPTATEKLAPKGHEALFVLVPLASGLKDTKAVREKAAKQAIALIEEQIGETFADDIVYQRIYTHKDFAEELNAYKGTALGIAHTLFQTAVFRPKRRSKKIKNLYYTGQYTHPGIGVPMVLISAELAAEAMK